MGPDTERLEVWRRIVRHDVDALLTQIAILQQAAESLRNDLNTLDALEVVNEVVE